MTRDVNVLAFERRVQCGCAVETGTKACQAKTQAGRQPKCENQTQPETPEPPEPPEQQAQPHPRHGSQQRVNQPFKQQLLLKLQRRPRHKAQHHTRQQLRWTKVSLRCEFVSHGTLFCCHAVHA